MRAFLILLLLSSGAFAQSALGQSKFYNSCFPAPGTACPSIVPTPTLIQQSSNMSGNCQGTTGISITCALPGASVQTNTLHLYVGVQHIAGGGAPTVSSVTSTNAVWTTPVVYSTGDISLSAVCATFTGTPGTQTATITFTSAPSDSSVAKLAEWSNTGCTQDGTAQTATNNSTSMLIPAVTTTHQAKELLGAICQNVGAAISGATSTYTQYSTLSSIAASAYFVTSSTGAQASDAVAIGAGGQWDCMAIATY